VHDIQETKNCHAVINMAEPCGRPHATPVQIVPVAIGAPGIREGCNTGTTPVAIGTPRLQEGCNTGTNTLPEQAGKRQGFSPETSKSDVIRSKE
jgi:hypothetical protein